MITFKDFIMLEDRNTAPQFIAEHCKEFFEDAGDEPMYRGFARRVPGKDQNFFFYEPRKDRRPRDSGFETHVVVDDWFEKHLGKRVRSEALFCSGSSDSAREYGKVCYVFPIGKFTYTWAGLDTSKKNEYGNLQLPRAVKDSGEIMDKVQHDMRGYKGSAEEVVDQIMHYYKWYDSHLDDALRSNAEIAVFCEKVIAVPTDEFDYHDLIPKG